MQLSFLAVSATALLAQAASGFYLLNTTHAKFAQLGFAKVNFGRRYADVGFYPDDGRPYAAIDLEAEGDIGTSFVLRKAPLGRPIWILLSRAAASIEPTDITGPFAVEADSRFVYKGLDGGVWNICKDQAVVGKYQLFLSTSPMSFETCIGNITLVATKFDNY